MSEARTYTLRIWRQLGPDIPGHLETYIVSGITPDASFLEMLDFLNEQCVAKRDTPIAFDSDCREGICGACGLVIDGVPHGHVPGVTTCQLFMRHYPDGATITVEPWRARAFPVVKDLVVDRSAFDRITAAGGYVSTNVGSAPDGNAIIVPKPAAEAAMDAAACIGCGACVAACKNASATLFVGAKVRHLGLLPQGMAEADRRALRMVAQMDKEGFGACSNEGECEAACPKDIATLHISHLIRDFRKNLLR